MFGIEIHSKGTEIILNGIIGKHIRCFIEIARKVVKTFLVIACIISFDFTH